VNSKQKKTLNDIFTKPTKTSILWADIEKLMLALGAIIKEGKGSVGIFVYQNSIFPFHKPHPQKEAKRYQIENLREFLTNKGVGL
jgi:hypothetical protein